ncbi:MAG: metallophosphoesterase family protein [Candidatus Aquicultor sp.]
MKALVISDTHAKWQEDIKALQRILEPFLDEVDVIIHAGDSVSQLFVDYIKGLKPTYIVAGNMDSTDVANRLPKSLVFELGGYRIGVTHGGGTKTGLKGRVFDVFKDERVDMIIFGHSHEAYLGKLDGIIMLNPGSPTDTRFADRNTVALVTADGGLTAEIVDV